MKLKELLEKTMKVTKADEMKIFTPEFLEWARKVTAYYDQKYPKGGMNKRAQMRHIMEECGESYAELINGTDDKLALELSDIIMCVVTMYHKIPISDKEIDLAMARTVNKINWRCGF